MFFDQENIPRLTALMIRRKKGQPSADTGSVAASVAPGCEQTAGSMCGSPMTVPSRDSCTLMFPGSAGLTQRQQGWKQRPHLLFAEAKSLANLPRRACDKMAPAEQGTQSAGTHHEHARKLDFATAMWEVEIAGEKSVPGCLNSFQG